MFVGARKFLLETISKKIKVHGGGFQWFACK